MNIPETQKDLLAYLDRMTREIGRTSADSASSSSLRFTTAAIADSLSISRNLASQYLNDLVRAGLVVKAGARPVHYFHRKNLERYLQAPIERNTYPTVDSLFGLRVGSEELDFHRAIGSTQSLAPCISQLRAAMEYPPSGLPVLMTGAAGTGKSMLAHLMLEYGKNLNILPADARFASIDCARYHDDVQGFIKACQGEDGAFASCAGGIIYLRDVHLLSVAAQEFVLGLVSAEGAQSLSLSGNPTGPSPRIVFSTSQTAGDPTVAALARRIPMTIAIPSLRERTQEERDELTLRFFKTEGRRMGTDILVSRGAIRCLATTTFEENVRGLRACITKCCAESYLSRKGDQLQIRTYQLPASILSSSALEHDEADAQLIDTTRGAEGQVDDRAAKILDSAAEAYSRIVCSTAHAGASTAPLLESFRDLEDYLAFGHAVSRTKSQAYEHIATGIIEGINTAYGTELSRKTSLLIAQAVCLQLLPPASLSRWKADHANELNNMRSTLEARHRFAATVSARLADELERTLGVSSDDLTRLLILSHICLTQRPTNLRSSLGIILSHGYSTATSIADAANRILHARIFEAIDMPYDQQLKDVVGPLQQLIDRFSYVEEVIILVDMGSLREIHKSLSSVSNMTLGIINNASTGLALEVGAGLMSGRSAEDILADAADACRCSYSIIERSSRQAAIVFCAEGGVDAAEKIKALISQSFEQQPEARLIACDYRKLLSNGTDDSIFGKYDVRAIIGTDDPQVAGVPFIALEDLISGEGASQVDRALAGILDTSQLASLHQNLVKNMTLRNVVESITILNPNTLFSEIERAAAQLQELTGDAIDGRTTIGLYVHLCCLVERLVTRSPIETYADEERFSSEHADFIEAFRRSFAGISAHYRVEVPVTEIAYAYDYINSRHAPRKRVIPASGPEARDAGPQEEPNGGSQAQEDE